MPSHESYRFTVSAVFREMVRLRGAAEVLRLSDGTTMSYAELHSRANRVAALLLERGLRRRDVLAIVHDKCATCYATMLAALSLGVVYCNVDDENPPERLRHILHAATPKAVLGHQPSAALRAAAADAAVIDLASADVLIALNTGSDADPAESRAVIGSDPAYIMFTSGSTGIPKGALISHASVVNFGAWLGERFKIGPGDVLSNVNPMYFDNSVFDFYGALLNGATLVPITRSEMNDPPRVIASLERAGCTVWFSVPSLLIYLMTLRVLQPSSLPKVRAFVFGGEGYPKPELRKLYALFGERSRLINVYGPTECTCICSAWDVGTADLVDERGFVTLGPMAKNFDLRVLDDRDVPVAFGEAGELCLLGPQVGLGYINDSERTAAAFVRDPTNPHWDERMYRTGDLVRLHADGRVDFVGRKDNQVKHMGYRIELEEIEAALNRLPGIVQSAVLQRTGRSGRSNLVAYVSGGAERSEAELRAELAKLLPPYMIPQRFVVREALPKNANGKVDRRALADEAL